MALNGTLNALGRANVEGGKTLSQLKGLFFDRPAVTKAIDAARRKGLSRCGAFVRRRAQTSMRYRKGASSPGSPPSAHKDKRLARLKKLKLKKHNGALLRELLFFAYDPLTRSVVVGPLGFRGSPVPKLHEFGGTENADGRVMYVNNPPGRDPKTGRVFTRGVHRVVLRGTVRYPKRPHMQPALQAVQAKFADQFRGTIGR